MNARAPLSCRAPALVGLALLPLLLHAQQSPAPSPAPATKAADEPIVLSPFVVESTDDRGYQAANTLGATRTNVAIRDLPMQINVVTDQLMADRALFDLDQVMDVIPGAARTFNEFVPQFNVRGFDSSAAMRNGVRGLTTPDMTAIDRVETIKGPAALLYGQTQPGGVINYITKNPSARRSSSVRVSAGSDGLFRTELDATGPLNAGKSLLFRLGGTFYQVDYGERQRSLERVAIAPMLTWKPRAGTSLTFRYSNTHDRIKPAEGLALKPTGAINRGGDPAYFYPFNGLDPVTNPQWITSVGPDFVKDSPSSFRDYKPQVWEMEGTQKLNEHMDLRVNFAYHVRDRSSAREAGTGLVNPWTQANPTIAFLNGLNSWNLNNTPGELFPEAAHTYTYAGRNGVPDGGLAATADTRLLDGVPYTFNASVPTLQYVPGVTGWRRVSWIGNNRRETRVNGQIDLVTRFKAGPFENTLLTGVEHNEDRVWDNSSTLVRDPALGVGGATLYTVPGTTTQIPNVVDYWYNIFSATSIAARDAYAGRNGVGTLGRYTSNGANNDQRFTSNSFYANLSSTFLGNRGRLAIGGRFDDVSARNTTKNPGVNPLVFDGAVTGSITGARQRVTPQAGLSFRITDPVTVYVLFSQSVNPRVTFQPIRTTARETTLTTAYTTAGLAAPDLNSKPWGQLLEPEFGESYEAGFKADLFDGKAMINAAVFTIEKRNVSRAKASSDPDSSVGFLDLSGVERAQGVDIDFYLRPVAGLQIGGGGLYNDTKILEAAPLSLATPLATAYTSNTGPTATYTLVGKTEPNAAKYSGNVYARYEVQEGGLKGMSFGASCTYMGPRRENDTLRWSQPWSRVDLNVGYRTKFLGRKTSFSLVVRNVGDRIYRVDRDTYARPRQFVASTSMEF